MRPATWFRRLSLIILVAILAQLVNIHAPVVRGQTTTSTSWAVSDKWTTTLAANTPTATPAPTKTPTESTMMADIAVSSSGQGSDPTTYPWMRTAPEPATPTSQLSGSPSLEDITELAYRHIFGPPAYENAADRLPP